MVHPGAGHLSRGGARRRGDRGQGAVAAPVGRQGRPRHPRPATTSLRMPGTSGRANRGGHRGDRARRRVCCVRPGDPAAWTPAPTTQRRRPRPGADRGAEHAPGGRSTRAPAGGRRPPHEPGKRRRRPGGRLRDCSGAADQPMGSATCRPRAQMRAGRGSCVLSCRSPTEGCWLAGDVVGTIRRSAAPSSAGDPWGTARSRHIASWDDPWSPTWVAGSARAVRGAGRSLSLGGPGRRPASAGPAPVLGRGRAPGAVRPSRPGPDGARPR